MLVAVGAYKEEADNDGMTSLMEAARYDHVEIAKMVMVASRPGKYNKSYRITGPDRWGFLAQDCSLGSEAIFFYSEQMHTSNFFCMIKGTLITLQKYFHCIESMKEGFLKPSKS